MSDLARNRPDSKKATDEWLTPPEIVAELGPFDLDPCCHPRMPWRTATTMIGIDPPGRGPVKVRVVQGDGLAAGWLGRVFINPPYSDILPWVEKLARHGDGVLLVPAKSTDTKWGQKILETATAILFMRGRIAFHFPSGKKSTGGWGPSMLAAYGGENVRALERVRRLCPGVILTRTQGEQA